MVQMDSHENLSHSELLFHSKLDGTPFPAPIWTFMPEVLSSSTLKSVLDSLYYIESNLIFVPNNFISPCLILQKL